MTAANIKILYSPYILCRPKLMPIVCNNNSVQWRLDDCYPIVNYNALLQFKGYASYNTVREHVILPQKLAKLEYL